MSRYIVILLLLGTFVDLSAQEWEFDYNKALLKAKKENKTLILVFQGSDWCSNCIKLEHNILNSDTFKKYANDKLVLLKVDFPRRKKNQLSEVQQQHNNKLAEKYNAEGYFPLLVMLDDEGTVKEKLGNENVSPQAYVEKIKHMINH